MPHHTKSFRTGGEAATAEPRREAPTYLSAFRAASVAFGRYFSFERTPVPKPNYGFQKRQKELAKQQKREAKAQRRKDRVASEQDPLAQPETPEPEPPTDAS